MEIAFGNLSTTEEVTFGQTYSDEPSIIDDAIREAVGVVLTLDPKVVNVDRAVRRSTTMVVTVGAQSAAYVTDATEKLQAATEDGQLTKLVDKAITTLSLPGNPNGLGHSVGKSTLLTSHALPNVYTAAEQDVEKSNQKSISMWFMVCFGVAGVLVVIGSVHVYLMFKYGWDKTGIEEEEYWDEWYDEEAYEEEEVEEQPAVAYQPPKPSYGDDEEGQILAAAETAGINMNDSQALIAFTKEWKAGR